MDVTHLPKNTADILRIPLTIWPTEWMWSNYLEVLVTSSRPLWKYVINTLIIIFFAELGVLISNTAVAFSFSRLHWKGRDMMFVLVLATMMLPAQVTMIPIFALFTAKLHWTNTYLPLIVPHFFGAALGDLSVAPIYDDHPNRFGRCGSHRWL